MPETYQLLQYQVNVLKLFRIWPREEEEADTKLRTIQKYILLLLLTPNTIPLAIDVFLIVPEADCDISLKIHSVLTAICTTTLHYMLICTLRNSDRLKKMVKMLHDMQKYRADPGIYDVDKRATFLTKLMMVYSIGGALIYSLMPLLAIESCLKMRTQTMIEWGIPCGLICRVRPPFKFDYSPMYEIMYVHQIFLVFTVSLVICFLTMVMYALILMVTHHMQMLRQMLLELSECRDDLEGSMLQCILYHIDIIEFCEDFNTTFSSQAFMYMSVISTVTGLLGFEIFRVDAFDRIRVTLHFLGVILLDLIVCFMGQTLINESVAIAYDAYATPWYNFPVAVQKDIKMIIMRAQKPIVWSTLSFGYLSLELFLKIMSSAYSYLTLLSNAR